MAWDLLKQQAVAKDWSIGADEKKGSGPDERVRKLAEKWGPVFDVDPSWIVTHAFVESTNKPTAHNESGGAWGLMQLKVPTAADIVGRLKKVKGEPRITTNLKKWHGQGEDLLDPDLNLMLGTYYLGWLKKRFKTDDHEIVAAAYNQGPGAVDKALKKGLMTENMHKYLAKVEDAKEKGYM